MSFIPRKCEGKIVKQRTNSLNLNKTIDDTHKAEIQCLLRNTQSAVLKPLETHRSLSPPLKKTRNSKPSRPHSCEIQKSPVLNESATIVASATSATIISDVDHGTDNEQMCNAKNNSSKIPLRINQHRGSPKIRNLSKIKPNSNKSISKTSFRYVTARASSKNEPILKGLSSSQRRALEMQMQCKKKQMNQLRNEICDKQKALSEVYQNLVQLTRKLNASEKEVPLSNTNLLNCGDGWENFKSDKNTAEANEEFKINSEMVRISRSVGKNINVNRKELQETIESLKEENLEKGDAGNTKDSENCSSFVNQIKLLQEKLNSKEQKLAKVTTDLQQTILDDAQLTVPELIKKYGYPCETHRVATPDGCILNMHRIPYGRTGNSDNRPVAYVQHGVLSSSADWIIPGPEKALGYILADAGYDVWIPNARGTRYSRDHLTLDPDNAKFWDFSWHEIAIYDVPTMIDYALNVTKQEKLFYIGHSQGTTVFYVMCSEKPEYNNKIRAQFSLAPIGYMSHMTSPLLHVISIAEGGIGAILQVIGVNEFVPNTGFLGRVGKILCSDDSVTQILCTNALFAVCGFNQKQMNATLLPVIMGHTPAGASTKQLLHYAQEINSGKFRQYDYGFSGNKKQYGSSEIPRYQLNKVTAPVYLFYSRNDWLSAERDVMRLYVELANVQERFIIADEKFNHIDYLYAIQARELVYDPLITLMGKH